MIHKNADREGKSKRFINLTDLITFRISRSWSSSLEVIWLLVWCRIIENYWHSVSKPIKTVKGVTMFSLLSWSRCHRLILEIQRKKCRLTVYFPNQTNKKPSTIYVVAYNRVMKRWTSFFVDYFGVLQLRSINTHSCWANNRCDWSWKIRYSAGSTQRCISRRSLVYCAVWRNKLMRSSEKIHLPSVIFALCMVFLLLETPSRKLFMFCHFKVCFVNNQWVFT